MHQPDGTHLPARDGSADGFDFTHHIQQVAVDMSRRLPQLAHLDMSRVAVAFNQTRKRVSHGLYASLTPLRFEDGRLETVRRGRRYTVQRLYAEDGREMLYLLRFYLPRFLDTDFQEKLVTILHELWHISPDFNGDLRRHAGRCYAHTHSQAEYDAHMADLARQWLERSPPAELYEFLHYSFREIIARHGGMYGTKIQQPKLLPLADEEAA